MPGCDRSQLCGRNRIVPTRDVHAFLTLSTVSFKGTRHPRSEAVTPSRALGGPPGDRAPLRPNLLF